MQSELDKFGRPYPAKQGGYYLPQFAADAIVIRPSPDSSLEILLVTRGHFPYEGLLAFPGGRVNYNEDPAVGVIRELKEECGVDGRVLELITVEGDPQRDPRGHIISAVYRVEISFDAHIVPGDDAVHAQFYPLREILENPARLAFDHEKILKLAVRRMNDNRYEV